MLIKARCHSERRDGLFLSSVKEGKAALALNEVRAFANKRTIVSGREKEEYAYATTTLATFH